MKVKGEQGEKGEKGEKVEKVEKRERVEQQVEESVINDLSSVDANDQRDTSVRDEEEEFIKQITEPKIAKSKSELIKFTKLPTNRVTPEQSAVSYRVSEMNSHRVNQVQSLQLTSAEVAVPASQMPLSVRASNQTMVTKQESNARFEQLKEV